jgi:hypothetical protein
VSRSGAGHEKILVLQVCRKNRLGLFRELELAEGTVDLGFIAAVGMILEADTDGFAVRSQCLEGITPRSWASARRSRNSTSLEMVMPAFLRESRKVSKDSLLKLPICLSVFDCGV